MKKYVAIRIGALVNKEEVKKIKIYEEQCTSYIIEANKIVMYTTLWLTDTCETVSKFGLSVCLPKNNGCKCYS